MIHPRTRLHHINDVIGYGLFAAEFIPKGTITYVKDPLEPEISPEEFERHTPEMQQVIDKYSYTDERGTRIVSWDFGKYVNHCCNSNTISTGYGFEIAIRDIQPGEEITDEYGIFNIDEPMQLYCHKPGCRGVLRPEDFDNYYRQWDEKIKPALLLLPTVEQPLLPFFGRQTLEEVKAFLTDPTKYKSVYALKFHGKTNTVLRPLAASVFS